MFDMTNRQLEEATDHLSKQVQTLSDRVDEHYHEICEDRREYWRELEKLKPAIRELQATLGLSRLIDEP